MLLLLPFPIPAMLINAIPSFIARRPRYVTDSRSRRLRVCMSGTDVEWAGLGGGRLSHSFHDSALLQ